MKRTAILTFTFILAGLLANAQKEYKKPLSGIFRIEIETGASVKIIKGASNEIIITNRCNSCGDENEREFYHNEEDDNAVDERAKGLTPVYAEGKDNTSIGMFQEQDGEVLRIKDLKSFYNRKGLTISVPSSVSLSIDTGNLGSVDASDLASDLEINTRVGHIKLNNVTGPVTAHSSTGNIDVVFTNLKQDAPISISSSTGMVDVSLPSGAKASVDLKSTMGYVFTNFDLVKPREDGLKPIGGNRSINGDINNGGVKISLKASTGNIYLRKK